MFACDGNQVWHTNGAAASESTDNIAVFLGQYKHESKKKKSIVQCRLFKMPRQNLESRFVLLSDPSMDRCWASWPKHVSKRRRALGIETASCRAALY